MNFRAEFFPKQFPNKISHRDNILMMGSCFTEQIGAKLSAHKFRILDNPNGILFNPVSISHALEAYVKNKSFNAEDLFFRDERWGSWQHHTKFCRIEKNDTLNAINQSLHAAGEFIKTADWIMLTLGSSFVYQRNDEEAAGYKNVVANCHKVPNDKFERRLLDASEIIAVLEQMMRRVKEINPEVKFLFTISPVRHLREGFIENNRSKAALIQAVHTLVNEKTVFYFPAYELVIDDLRDYRFFAEDLVHPNYAATNYVWEKFTETVLSAESIELAKKINVINAARAHKPFSPLSEAHQKFKKVTLEKIHFLQEHYPYLDLQSEADFFS